MICASNCLQLRVKKRSSCFRLMKTGINNNVALHPTNTVVVTLQQLLQLLCSWGAAQHCSCLFSSTGNNLFLAANRNTYNVHTKRTRANMAKDLIDSDEFLHFFALCLNNVIVIFMTCQYHGHPWVSYRSAPIAHTNSNCGNFLPGIATCHKTYVPVMNFNFPLYDTNQ